MSIIELRAILDVIEDFSKSPIAGAGHDVIYWNVTVDDIPEKSPIGKKLSKLGCHVEDEESWAKFV